MRPNSSIVRRLAFAKYLYGLAIEQSRRAEPFSSASVLYFHDSIELYFQIASEHLNVGGKRLLVMDYFDLLKQKIAEDKELYQKETVRRLDKARIALKHHGTLPSRLDTESFRVSLISFFSENTPLLFGIEFSQISLTEFVSPYEVKVKLVKAEKLEKKGDFLEALELSSLAFRMLLDDWKDRKTIYGGSPLGVGIHHPFSPFSKLRTLKTQTSTFSSEMRAIDDEFTRMKQDTEKALSKLEESVEILALGVDFKRYSRFKSFTPSVMRGINKEYVLVETRYEKPVVQQEDVAFCINFVVETSLVLQEFDYSLPSRADT